tara:strand:- start:42 stop:671 length:630 start_codon:yes stop_codon:yes gene_type:complete
VFVKPAILLFSGAFAVHLWVQDEPPESLRVEAVPVTELEHIEVETNAIPPATTKKPNFLVTVFRVMKNPALRMLILAMICVGWVREGLLSWYTSYLEDVLSVPVGSPFFTITSTGITLGGMFGSMGGGWVSDRFFNSNRVMVLMIYFVVEGLAVFVFSTTVNPVLAAICITITATCLFGCLTLVVGCAAADFAGKDDAGTATGVLLFFR